jgi:hypothetical protein
VKTLPLTKKQAEAILFALGEEYSTYDELDPPTILVVRRLFKLFPELKDAETNSDLVWYLEVIDADKKPA